MYNEKIDKTTERTDFTTYSVKDAMIDYIIVECVLNIHDEEKRKQMIRIVEDYLVDKKHMSFEDRELMMEIFEKITLAEHIALKQMREKGIIDEMYHISKEWRNLYDN